MRRRKIESLIGEESLLEEEMKREGLIRILRGEGGRMKDLEEVLTREIEG